ncbi:MAG TPA: MFS transporter [Acidimicrobiales bacterium]|nr:MFS transporter [Acidimicrobiales bacterium]
MSLQSATRTTRGSVSPRRGEANVPRAGGVGVPTPGNPAPGNPAPGSPVAGGAAPWAIFAICSIALFMSSLDGTIVSTGLPTLRNALHTRLNWASWTMTGYQLGLVVAMPIAGRVADTLGRKRVFLWAAGLFTVSSLLCGLATNIAVLVALRVVQAAGGAAFMPAASGIVMQIFPEHRRQRALGMFSSIFPLGALVGPIAGGIILATWSWRGVFLVNVPIGATFTFLAWRCLPKTGRGGNRPDIVGALLMGGAALGLMLAITDLGNRQAGLLTPSVVLPFALAVAGGWAFVRHCSSHPHPLIPVHLLRGRVFQASNLINLVWGACAIGFGSLVPLFAEDRFHFSPLTSGTLLTARAIGEIFLAVTASVLIHRTGYRIPIIGGIALISSGLAMIAMHPLVVSPYVWLTVGATLTGIGTGMSAPAANNASVELAPDDVGAITGLRGAARQGGAIIGIALATSVAAHTGHEVATLTKSFFLLAVLLAAMVPLVFVIPDGRQRRATRGRVVDLQQAADQAGRLETA